MVKVVNATCTKAVRSQPWLRKNRKLLAVTTTVTSPPVTSVVVTSSTIVVIDFKRNKDGIPAKWNVSNTILTVPRTSLCCATPTASVYIIATKGMAVGDTVMNGSEAPIKAGNCLPIRNIPVGTVMNCVEMLPGKGAQMARTAGAGVVLMAREGTYAQVRLRSGEVRRVHIECRATVGEVGNAEHSLRKIGKAGAMRWRGVRPTVRGVVMNPIDHPHGGGEGRTAAGRHPVSPWGQQTKGKKTRSNKRTSSMIVSRRGKK
jgi:large subunit ribosomal protein L2